MSAPTALQLLWIILISIHHVQAAAFLPTQSKPVVHHSDKPIIMFQDLGHYHVVESYIHFRIPVPFKNFLDGLNTRIAHIIQEKNQAEHSINTSGFKTILHTIFDQGIGRLNALESKFLNMMDTLPQNMPTNKRFFDILGAFLGGTALSMATYNNHRVSQLDQEIRTLQTKHNLLADIAQVHEDHMKELDARMGQMKTFWRDYFSISPALLEEMINDYYLEMQDKFSTIQDTVGQALHGKLSNLLITPEVGKQIVKKVKSMAANLDAEIPIRETADLFHQDVSYLFDSNSFNFTLLVHIPVIPRDLIFSIQKYQPFPFKYANDIVIPELEEDILASNYINKDFSKTSTSSTKYFQTSQQELNNCKKIGDNFYCKGRSVYSTNKLNLCLGALQNGSIANVAQNCKLRRGINQEMVAQLNTQTWSIYLPEDTKRFAHCPTSFEIVDLVQFNLVRLPEGCRLDLPNHVIISSRNEPTVANTLVLLNWNLSNPHQWPLLDKDFKHRLDQGDLKFKDLHSQIEEAKISISNTTPHMGAAWAAIVAIVIIAISLGLYLGIRRFRQRPIHTGPAIYDTPANPPANNGETLSDYLEPSGPPGPFYQLREQLANMSKCCEDPEPSYPSDKPAPRPDYPQRTRVLPTV